MADDVIDSYIDRAGVKGDTDFIIKSLQDVYAEFKKLEAVKVSLKGVSGLSGIGPAMDSAKKGADGLSKATTKIKEEVKSVEQLMKQRIATDAKLITLSTDYAKQTVKNRVEIQAINKELKQQAQYDAAAPNSLERVRALRAKIRAEVDKTNLSDGARITQLNDRINKLTAIEKKFTDSQRQQSLNVGNYQGSAKIIVDALERIRLKQSEVNKQFGEGSPEAAKVRGEFEALNRITSNPGFLNISAKVGDTNAELKFFTKQLNQLEDAGQKNSATYKEIQARLAALTDQLGDTRAEIKALSSDTRSFDLFAGSVSFAADAMQTAAGASILFGASEEEAAQATKTLIAVQSVANGVKGIATELTTKGTAANKAYNFVMKEVSIITGTATTATQKFNSVLKLTGIGLLITGITTLISKLDIFGTSTKEAIDLADQLTESFENQKKALDDLAGDLDFQSKIQIEKLKQQGATDKVIFDAELKRKKDHLEELKEAELQALKKRGDAEKFYGDFVKTVNGKVAKETIEQAEKVSKVLNDEVGKRQDAVKKQQQEIELSEQQFVTKQIDNKRKSGKKETNDSVKDAIERQKEIDEALERLREENANRKFDRKTAQETLNDELQSRLEYGQKEFDRRKIQTEIFRDQELKDNQVAFNAGLRTQDEFAEKKIEIENDYQLKILSDQVKFYEVQLNILKSFGADTLEVEAAIAKAKLAIAEINTNTPIEGKTPEETRLENLAKTVTLLEKVKEKYDEISSVIGNAVSASVTAEKNRIQESIDALEEKKLKDIEAVNQTITNEKDKAASIAIIEARAAAQREQYERKQKEADRKKAIFDKANAIANIILNTAIAVTKFLSKGDVFEAISAGVIGAAQLAVAAATPIPRYRHGKKESDHYEGPAIVGDGGRKEAIVREDGTVQITSDRPQLTYVRKRDVVLPDANMLINHVIAGNMGARLSNLSTSFDANKDVVKGLKSVEKAIGRIPQTIVKGENRFKVMTRHGHSFSEYLNKNI